MLAGELINSVFVDLGDPHEERIPIGIVEGHVRRALQQLTELATQTRPEALRMRADQLVPENRDVIDLPWQLSTIEHVALVQAGEESIDLEKIDAPSEIAADIVGPAYHWFWVDRVRRKVRIGRPDIARGYEPGARFLGPRRFVLPPRIDVDLELPEGTEDFVRLRAALLGARHPEARLADVGRLASDLQQAREEAIRIFTFLDAASGAPIAENQPLW